MIKSPAELALMQAANDVMLASLRYAGERTARGMTRADIDAMIAAAQKKLGGDYDGGLVLIGEASAYPHGSKSRTSCKRGEIVLMDCTCSVHGYQADITRTFVFGADPDAEQRKLWDQVHRGQQIAMAAAKVGVPAGSVDDAVRRVYESWGYGPGYSLPGHFPSHRPRHRHGGARAGLSRARRDDAAGARHVLFRRAGPLRSGQVRAFVSRIAGT